MYKGAGSWIVSGHIAATSSYSQEETAKTQKAPNMCHTRMMFRPYPFASQALLISAPDYTQEAKGQGQAQT